MIDKRLIKECSCRKTYLPLSTFAAILNSFFIVVNAYLLALIVDKVFLKKESLSFIKHYILLFLVNIAVKALINFLLENCIKTLAEDIKEEIREKTFKRIIYANALKVKSEKAGELLNILTEGIEMLAPYFSQYIPQLFASVIIPVMLCLSAAFADRLSAVIMLITYPIIPLFMALIGFKSKEVNERQWRKLNVLSSHFIDMLQGLSTLKSFGRDKLQEEKVYAVSESYRKSTMEVLKVSFLSALALETASTISTAIIAVNLGLRLVYDKISFLNAFFILILAPDFYLPLRQLGLKFHASLNGQVAIEKIEGLQKSLEENNLLSAEFKLNEKKLEIDIRNLNFSHENREALNNVSFRINPGEKIALVGESGSGKSTLVNILSGLLKVPDGIMFVNGRDINSISKDSYMKNISIVPQFPYVFNKSIEDNILLNSKAAKDVELLSLYKALRLEDFIKQFKLGCKIDIGEGEEVEISGGEKQRIAIARAIIKDTNFIIMDEPTSALDSETEEVMQELLSDILKEKTVLISAHRLNTVRKADKILVLKEGQIVERGTHMELMSKRGSYYSLIRAAEEKVYDNI